MSEDTNASSSSSASDASVKASEKVVNTHEAVDDFYVGYLPTPKSHASTLRVIVPALLLGLAGVASVVAYVQRSPGTGMWSSDAERFTGIVLSKPVPMLICETPTGQQAMLLVEEGKHGAMARVAALHGKKVELTGTRLSREGRTVVEIAAGADSVKMLSQSDVSALSEISKITETAADSPTVTLRGEIVDSKCYHGAMKPGDGKSHKACATLCVSNGIPAMFAAINPNGTTSYYLLTLAESGTSTAESSQFDEDTLSKIGELVEVTGSVSRIADLNVLTIDAGSVRRVN